MRPIPGTQRHGDGTSPHLIQQTIGHVTRTISIHRKAVRCHIQDDIRWNEEATLDLSLKTCWDCESPSGVCLMTIVDGDKTCYLARKRYCQRSSRYQPRSGGKQDAGHSGAATQLQEHILQQAWPDQGVNIHLYR